MLLLAITIVFLAACAGILFGSIYGLRLAGRALSPLRPQEERVIIGLAAALCFAGVVGSAAMGFSGISAIMYLAQRDLPQTDQPQGPRPQAARP